MIVDHFTCYMRAYVTKDQKVETTVRYLYDGYISIFRCPEKIVSDHGCSFTSNLMTQLCARFGMEKAATMPFHAQCNGQVERAHQTLAQMIGKLEPEQKKEWPNHLAELTHAYNSTHLAVTGFSPHYLMLSCQPYLPIVYYFSVDQVMGRTKLVDEYMLKLVTTLRSTFNAAREVTQEEVAHQKRLYARKASVVTQK